VMVGQCYIVSADVTSELFPAVFSDFKEYCRTKLKEAITIKSMWSRCIDIPSPRVRMRWLGLHMALASGGHPYETSHFIHTNKPRRCWSNERMSTKAGRSTEKTTFTIMKTKSSHEI
jgi:hypothetical protein